MKKVFPMLFAAALLVSACEKTPDTGKLDNDYLVYTNYDDDTDFAKFVTFYVPDSVLIITGNADKPKYLYGTPASEIIIANYVEGMEGAGHTCQQIDADDICDFFVVTATELFLIQ